MSVSPSPTDCAYAAGFFDGEGAVQIMPAVMYPSGRCTARLYISVSQVDRRPLEWLAERFGGRVRTKAGRTRVNCRQVYLWWLCGPTAHSFLTFIRPYMVLKTAQADLAFEFYKTVQPKRGGIVVPLSKDIIDRREVMRLEMKRLNLRGAEWLRAAESATTA